MRIPAALCLFVLMCSEGAYAQAVAGFGAITGKVRDIYGDGIPDTTVTITNRALGLRLVLTTTDDGVFYAPALAPAAGYAVKVTRKGFTGWDASDLKVPFGMMKTAGADAVGFDLSQLRRGEEETLAELVEAGLLVFVGAVPATPGAAAGPSSDNHLPQRTTPGQLPSREAVAARVVELWRRMGWPAARGEGGSSGITAQVVITPACGLAGAPPEYAKAALHCCREAGRLLPELIEEEAG